MKKYLVFAVALFSLFLVNTKAATTSGIPITIFGNTVPQYFMVSKQSVKSGPVILVTYDVLDSYTYVLLDVCTTGAISDLKLSNTGYNSYFAEESILYYKDGRECAVNSSYTGYLVKIQFQVGKFGTADSSGEISVSSTLSFKNSANYNGGFRISNAYLSEEDVLTPLINSSKDSEKQQEIINKQTETNSKLDDVKGKQDEAEKTRKGILGKVGEILTSIVNLPKNIVNLVIDGLKSLFVPTDEQLYEIVNDSKELSENFGFVGEAVAFFLNIFTSLLGMINANGCIEMPAFKIGATSLFDEHTFWEARNVCLADNAILSANIDTIRTITSIVFVSLFLGFAARKFFSILSKSENEVNSE